MSPTPPSMGRFASFACAFYSVGLKLAESDKSGLLGGLIRAWIEFVDARIIWIESRLGHVSSTDARGTCWACHLTLFCIAILGVSLWRARAHLDAWREALWLPVRPEWLAATRARTEHRRGQMMVGAAAAIFALVFPQAFFGEAWAFVTAPMATGLAVCFVAEFWVLDGVYKRLGGAFDDDGAGE